MEQINFENLPAAVSKLLDKVSNIERQLFIDQQKRRGAAVMTYNRTPKPSYQKGQCKDKGKRLLQIEKVVEALKAKPATMLMVTRETGIERANICRYIATLLKQNETAVIRKGLCEITQHRAGYYTTDKSLFPSIHQQLTLF